jgi:ParB family transcriptional regulator, chromosome partitioning protein
VAERGGLQPIRVRLKGDRFEVISGERRCRAARRVGIRVVPAIVVRQDDEDSLVDALVENIHREDLKAVDRSRALRRLRVTLGLHSWEEVGRRVGLSRMHAHRLLNVTKLPADIQDDLRIADMSEKHVRALHSLCQHPELLYQLFDEVAEQELGGDAAIAATQALLYGEAHDDEAGSATLARNVDGLLSTLNDANTRTLRVHRSRLRQLAKRVGEVLRDLDEGDAAVRTRRRAPNAV